MEENEKSVGRAKMATQHALLSKDPKNVILSKACQCDYHVRIGTCRALKMIRLERSSQANYNV